MNNTDYDVIITKKGLISRIDLTLVCNILRCTENLYEAFAHGHSNSVKKKNKKNLKKC